MNKAVYTQNGTGEFYSLTASAVKIFKDESILWVNELNPTP
ncbi:hypothetical protein GPUN_1795 [Glaciecola punicea ACAM 611]|jgi:hypothetical protein|uniref:Uncharacterized protein n=1 Tax=Glaciecola punicea ACAM 611 TaxID=1121923 RepID=H5TC84_9ALTE|nr:hypothetical protein [Glaciecola punicea]GAB55911.1 hypothetical protein GPUN_1795 [Glaciecola punicea ACAM 611]